MKDLKAFVHSRLDKFAEQYEGSSTAQNLILLKSRFDLWFDSKINYIRNFYKSDEDKISIICNNLPFSVRLTFYKNGHVNVLVEHNNSISIRFEDREVISQFCLDIGYVYFIESEFGWKIGKTKNLERRKKIFDVKLPFKYALRYYIKTHEKTKLENYFHNYFETNLINGEWFLINSKQIEEAFSTCNGYKLSQYEKDNNTFIDKKYLIQFDEKVNLYY